MSPSVNTDEVSCVTLPDKTLPSAYTAAKILMTAVPPNVYAATAVPPAGEQIRIVLMDAQSVRNKSVLINEYVRDEAINILAITEAWLK